MVVQMLLLEDCRAKGCDSAEHARDVAIRIDLDHVLDEAVEVIDSAFSLFPDIEIEWVAWLHLLYAIVLVQPESVKALVPFERLANDAEAVLEAVSLVHERVRMRMPMLLSEYWFAVVFQMA
jgi:hypothetical protein